MKERRMPQKRLSQQAGTLGSPRKLTRAKTGPQYWRTLDELAQTPEFEEMLHREFPRQASEWVGGAALASRLPEDDERLAGAGRTEACIKQPLEPIVPYVRQPEQIMLGKPLFFATAMPFRVCAVRCWSKAMKAVRPRSKAIPSIRQRSAAATSSRRQAILTMYDPDRSQVVTYLGEMRPLGSSDTLRFAGP